MLLWPFPFFLQHFFLPLSSSSRAKNIFLFCCYLPNSPRNIVSCFASLQSNPVLYAYSASQPLWHSCIKTEWKPIQIFYTIYCVYGCHTIITKLACVSIFCFSGFLNTNAAPTSRAQVANYGLMDQTAVLQWVQENGRQFGGDPNRVTLFGHGTGAACIEYLAHSPTTVPGNTCTTVYRL